MNRKRDKEMGYSRRYNAKLRETYRLLKNIGFEL